MKTERFYVDVVSLDRHIPEYQERCSIVDQRTTTNTCWIPSEAGKAFRINISNLTGDCVEARCFIDGRFLSRVLVKPGDLDYMDGVQVTDSAVRPFVFSDVMVIDDENALIPTTYNSEKFGTIEVYIHRVIVRQEYDWNRGQLSYSNPGPIPEKSKKAGCHQVSLGEISAVPSILCADVLMMDKPEKPRANFIFWYRPLAILQAEGILPLPLRLDDRQTRKRPRTDSPLANESDGQSSFKRMKPDPSGLVYGTMDEIWQASLLLKPAYLSDQDLNLELIDEELETLKTQREVLADQLKDVDTKILEVSSRRNSRSNEPPPLGMRRDHAIAFHNMCASEHAFALS
ncbi:hypothetical protein EUX98_g9095 [Antrodiella citrinella]|uniref:DUF7918 domain-containing protein n=1 Tax=Antrodiella citrinella TaxID=2447956 RepID=A0A4S4LYE9_9APHY|nr:hypothetical protein EUX98_g9095 [Antrodiella citrinella]